MRAPNEGEVAVMLEMTPERRAKWVLAGDQVRDLLIRHFEAPFEACAFMQFLLDCLKDFYGVRESELPRYQTEMKQ